jgi:hypothetical protein
MVDHSGGKVVRKHFAHLPYRVTSGTVTFGLGEVASVSFFLDALSLASSLTLSLALSLAFSLTMALLLALLLALSLALSLASPSLLEPYSLGMHLPCSWKKPS